MSTATAIHPQVLWAQDKKRIFLTINVECKDPEIKITEDSLYFKGVGAPANKEYEVTINFLRKVAADKAVTKNIIRCIEFTIPKAEDNDCYWNTLTTDKVKPAWLKVDFQKWKDEDDDDGFGDDGFGDDMGMGMPGMGGMGGMGGMPGMGGMGGFGGANMDEMLKNIAGGGDGKPAFDDDEEEDSDDDIPPIE